MVAGLLNLQPCSVALCETHSLTAERTLSLIDRRRSDGGIGFCTPLEKEYGRGSWLWPPQTHAYLERKRCQAGTKRDEIRVWRLGENLNVKYSLAARIVSGL